MSKAEKRSRQILGKLNLELVPGISQVVMQTRNLGIWPSYRSLQNSSSSTVEYLLNPDYAKYERAQETPAVTADENDLGEGVSDKDIELVMSQSDCSKSAAIKALRDADGDLVSAILSLAN
uniref:Nascent polypeptide-associated complex subunit alpha-like UBA domain-containing protein n=1 Tax=Ditylenchus dipsaci TaxID=166011 RepID=A0A915CP42_9BILA